jgi:peptide-methionine (R)-S-oxide reductase
MKTIATRPVILGRVEIMLEGAAVSRRSRLQPRSMTVASYAKNPEKIAGISPEQFRITQEAGAEPRFRNAFWDSKAAGLYVDIVSGEPLFSSTDKFDSKTGWPSFTRPVDRRNVVEKRDTSHGMIRTEVRSAHGDSHLGHLFPDGPRDAGGGRYCINSASLRFVPLADLEAEGYGAYLDLFESAKT